MKSRDLVRSASCAGVLALIFALGPAQVAAAGDLSAKERLGKRIFFDTNLSVPKGQSCGSCHDPKAGFADPDPDSPTSAGAITNRFGSRNAPSAAYAFGTPAALTKIGDTWFGGTFWDGRTNSLVDQAKQPFLNPVEMNNPSKARVVNTIRKSDYAKLFRKVWGAGAFGNVSTAYERITSSLAAYQRSAEVNPFTSKFDYYLKGQARLTPAEMMGLQVFNGKGQCSSCHTSGGTGFGMTPQGPLFTNHQYSNVGTPRNSLSLFFNMPKTINPAGDAFIDYGLGAVLARRAVPGAPGAMGLFKTPTLRNVAKTSPYMHNGVFAALIDVVHFYNMRDVAGTPMMPVTMPNGSPMLPPEVMQNLNTTQMGKLGLTRQEGMALVAFMNTLTDGYVPAP